MFSVLRPAAPVKYSANMAIRIPATTDAPLIRTDFTDQPAWLNLIELVRSPQGDFQANVQPVDDIAFEALTVAESAAAAPTGHTFLLLADGQALTSFEHSVAVVEVGTARTFRVLPAQVWSVENNLSLGNLDFTDFLNSTDTDGVFRGFPIVSEDAS